MKLSKKWLLLAVVLTLVVAGVLAFSLRPVKALSAGTLNLSMGVGCTVHYEVAVITDAGGGTDEFYLEFWDNGRRYYTHYLSAPADGLAHTLSGAIAFDGGPAKGGAPGIGVYLMDDGNYIDGIDPFYEVEGCDASLNSTFPFAPANPVVDAVANPFKGVSYMGAAACGIFEMPAWGVKTIDPLLFPGCEDYTAEELMVACFTEDGEWTTANVVKSWLAGNLLFTDIRQHGTCGIFPK